jgi:CRP/FNR family cyclic AMP-dependent transcriptional regulator
MACKPQELRHVPLFSLLDDDELAVLSQQVELRDFAAKQRIYKVGESSTRAFVMLSGAVEVTLIDEDGQEVLFSEPRHGDVFGLASMLENTTHQTAATTTEATSCLEIDRNDIEALLLKKPMAGLDMMTVLARDIHTAQGVIRNRAMRNANELIDEQETFGERLADIVASFGGSWTFIILFGTVLTIYTLINIHLKGKAWDPYPFILLNLFLSMLASIQAPVIMMSQNRQDTKDRLRSELDFEVNRRAETEIQALSRKIHFLADKLGDIEDQLRGPNEPRREDDLRS